MNDQDRIEPMTWSAEGKLVPLTQGEQDRLLATAAEQAAHNAVLPENQVLSFRESLDLILLDIAHMIDLVFKPPDHLPIAIAAQPPIFALILLVFLLRMAWMVVVPCILLIVAFRLWVWLTIEKPRATGTNLDRS